ncbi:hypothetical protein L211DRAFT_841841, partial [Terfezia boudieri ATCC MYA-4762]
MDCTKPDLIAASMPDLGMAPLLMLATICTAAWESERIMILLAASLSEASCIAWSSPSATVAESP